MAESDEVTSNLAFLLGSDPVEGGDAPDEAPAPEETETPQESIEAPPQDPNLLIQPVQEDPNERRFRGVLNELRDTREERRMLREELEALRSDRERAEQAWQQQNAPAPPDKDADPAAWLAYQNRAALYEIEQRRMEEQQVYMEQQEAQRVRGEFYNTVGAVEQQFRAERPDYDNAVSYVKNMRHHELMNQGFDPVDAEQQVKREIMGFSALHLGNGQSPAKAAYDYAVSRGYQPAQAQAPQAYYPTPTGASNRLNTSLSSVPGNPGGGMGVTMENFAQQPISTQNYIFDTPELWGRINMGEKIYV